MATAHPKLALRPFLPVDTPLLAEIFRESVADLTAEDYSRGAAAGLGCRASTTSKLSPSGSAAS